MNAEGRTDPRVRRTRSALQDAIIELTHSRPLGELSVSRVSAEAGVSRQTFYDHYGDLDDLVVAALHDEFEELRTISRQTGELAADDDACTPPGLLRLARFLHEHRVLLARALGPDGSPGFAHWLREMVTADVEEGLAQRPERQHPDVPRRVQSAYVAGALLGVLVPGVATGADDDPERLADQVWSLLRRQFTPAEVTAATAG